MSPFSLFFLILFFPPILSSCNEFCGDIFLPYPFHLNSSCGPKAGSFRLTCTQRSNLFLSIGLADLRVISFLTPTSILIDYSSKSNSKASSCDRWYADLNEFSSGFNKSAFFAVTGDNVLRLYDCGDSSVCRIGCERAGGCAGVHEGCCYPLWDGSVWKVGEGFGVFGEGYGCRGFSSWVEKGGLGGSGRRGIEVEWAVPRRFVEDVGCADGAVMVNASAVEDGYRCACGNGLVGDGFAHGIGCFKGDSLDCFFKFI